MFDGNMETVIPPDRIRGHVIQKYTFKVLTTDDLEKRAEGQCQEKGGTEPYIFGELGTDNEDMGTEPAAAEMVGSETEAPPVASDAILIAESIRQACV